MEQRKKTKEVFIILMIIILLVLSSTKVFAEDTTENKTNPEITGETTSGETQPDIKWTDFQNAK